VRLKKKTRDSGEHRTLRHFLGRLVVVATLVGGTLCTTTEPAMAVGFDCGNNGGFHYAGHVTGHSVTLTNCVNPQDEYTGWNGVNGQLKVPSQLITLQYYRLDHVSGWLGAQFNQVTRWLLVGSYTGTIGLFPCPRFNYCIQRNSTSYGFFVEQSNSLGYFVYDLGTAPLSGVVVSRVVYNAASGCWEAYLTYTGGLNMQDCSGEPASTSMWAMLEASSSSGTLIPAAQYNFGASNPNTTPAMRLHGANGWEPWDETLTAQTTDSFDERYSTPTYIVSNFNRYYYFMADGP
jgi:hypothetical protein